MKIGTIFQMCFMVVFSLGDETVNETLRKHYGLSYHVKCDNYVKTFTCMTACKSIGFQVFRMDHRCKCSCHELKTTTLLPFFKWRTNGTTISWHSTFSAPLYHIVGTLSPPTYFDYNDAINETTSIPLSDGGNASISVNGNDTVAGQSQCMNGSLADSQSANTTAPAGAPAADGNSNDGGTPPAGGATAAAPADGGEPTAPAEGATTEEPPA